MMDKYFDAMASTPVHPKVLAAMQAIYTEFPGNPSSTHTYGAKLSEKLQVAKQAVQARLNAQDYEVIWTSGATEAINLALVGAAKAYARQGRHLITFTTEHAATLATFAHLATLGFTTSILPVKANGMIEPKQLMAAITPETTLVAFAHVNNELGGIQDLTTLVKQIQARGCLVHIDAAQSIGKAPLDLTEAPADFVALSAHKFQGPTGIGALLYRKKPMRQLQPLLFGGKQQAYRPGTLPAALIVGLATAISLEPEQALIKSWAKMLQQMGKALGGVTIHGCQKRRVPHNYNIHVAGIDTTSLKLLLADYAIASGSACNAGSLQPSHVIQAIGYDAEHAAQAIRISLGAHLSTAAVTEFCQKFTAAVQTLRQISGYNNA